MLGQQIYSTPESHVWELVNVEGRAYTINKITGETRTYTRMIKMDRTIGLKQYTGKSFKFGENPKASQYK